MISRIFLAATILFLTRTVYSQQQNPFLNDANGHPLFWGSTYIPDGSPYYLNDYNWAEITVSTGKIYKDVRVKINILECQVQYLTEDEKEMIATTPIKSIRFPGLSFQDEVLLNVVLSGGPGLLNEPGASVYQVLDSGKVSLLKKISITYRDEKKYGEAVTTRHFDRKEIDYLHLSNGEFKKLEKNRSFLTDIMADKKNEIDAYIDKNNIKCKTTKDCQQVIIYYNSL